MKQIIVGACLLTVLGVTGCGTRISGGVAETPMGLTAMGKAAESVRMKHEGDGADAYTSVLAACSTLPEQADCRARRNRAVYELLMVMDYYYLVYEGNIIAGRANGSFYTDTATAFLATGSAAASGNLATALAALASLTTTTKATWDRAFYADRTDAILLMRMRADRTEIRRRIDLGLSVPYADYTMPQAVNDLHVYFRAGTLASAVVGLSTMVSAKTGEQEVKLQSEQRDRLERARDKEQDTTPPTSP